EFLVIRLVTRRVGPERHRTELVDLKTAALVTDPFLTEKYRAGRDDLRDDCHHQGAEGQNGEGRDAARQIDGAFPQRKRRGNCNNGRGEVRLIAYGMHKAERADPRGFYYLFIIRF